LVIFKSNLLLFRPPDIGMSEGLKDCCYPIFAGPRLLATTAADQIYTAGLAVDRTTFLHSDISLIPPLIFTRKGKECVFGLNFQHHSPPSIRPRFEMKRDIWNLNKIN